MALSLIALLAGAALTGCGQDAPPARPGVLTDWKTWTRADGLPGDTVWVVLPTQQGVWVGTTAGLAFFDGQRFKRYLVSDGLVHQAVTSLTIDPEDDTLWIGTLGGVSHLVGEKFTNYTQANSGLVNNVVYAVAVQKPWIWMATTNGLCGYDRSTGAYVTYDDRNGPFHENWCYGATMHDDKLYLAVWGGGLVIRERSGKWTNFMDPDRNIRVDLLPNDGILSDIVITPSISNGRCWLASYFGVGMFDGRRWKTYTTANSGLPRNFVNTVKGSGDGVWVGSDFGLSHFDGLEEWVTYQRQSERPDGIATVFRGAKAVERIPIRGAPGSDFIWSVAEDPVSKTLQRMWVGTARGLSLGSGERGKAL